ncbi:MAG: hypothetical protein COA47_12430 [Robiginitomaculum sp.]|nr:MAG: hypothetical protein COA47_12430 [Robiginitomaculum sp.]
MDDARKKQKQLEAKKRKALARLRRAQTKKDTLSEDNKFTEWEDEFVGGLEERLEKFDSAFVDLEKGRSDEALSYRQAYKLKEIEDKIKGKKRKPMNRGSGFGNKTPKKKYGVRSYQPDEPDNEIEPTPPKAAGPPKLQVIKGGKI